MGEGFRRVNHDEKDKERKNYKWKERNHERV